MKGTGVKIIALFAFIYALTMPVSLARERIGDCRSVSAQIAGFAGGNGVNRISLAGFTAGPGVEAGEAEYISETIETYLAGRKKPVLVERAQLGKILNETRLAASAGSADKAELSADIFSVDAVVTGTVFAAGDKLKVLVKLIEVRTGNVRLAALAEEERELPYLPETSDIAYKWDGPAFSAPPPDLRDSLSDSWKSSCAERETRLGRLNADLVEEKARYWATRMKEPGFNMRSLTRNPGSEITNPSVKARFYALLGAYAREDSPPLPEPDRVPMLMKLLAEESRFANECSGLYSPRAPDPGSRL